MDKVCPEIKRPEETYKELLARGRSPFFLDPKKRNLNVTKKALESEVFHLHPFLKTGGMNVQPTCAWLFRNSERRFYLGQTDETGLHST